MRQMNHAGMPVCVSWSGGKESCMALWSALRAGYAVKALVNMASKETGRCCFHGLTREALGVQAEALALPLAQGLAPADMAGYEAAFKRTVTSVPGIAGMFFGDVYLEEHRTWIERVCAEMGIRAIEPLWGSDPGCLVRDFIRLGFEAVIVSCDARLTGPELCGQRLDEAMLAEFDRRGFCPCGERGEYHTFVVDGPVFRSRIEIVQASVARRNGAWPRWALDVREVRLAARAAARPDSAKLGRAKKEAEA